MTDVETLRRCIDTGHKILICGNGGSAAQAQHLAAELVVRYVKDRPGIAAIALTADSAVLTACANDYGYERVFSRQIEALGRPGDVLIALSTSGKSQNVIKAIKQARKQRMEVIESPRRRDSGAAVNQEDHQRWLHQLCEELHL